MTIEIPLGGQIRRIKWDGLNFKPLPLKGEAALGYYTKFGNAVAKLVKEVANTDEIIRNPDKTRTLKEETLSIKQFVNRFEAILQDINNIQPEHFQEAREPLTEEPDMYAETEKESLTEPVFEPQEEEDIDGL